MKTQVKYIFFVLQVAFALLKFINTAFVSFSYDLASTPIISLYA